MERIRRVIRAASSTSKGRAITLTCIFVVLVALAALWSFAPRNIQYTVNFANEVPDSTAVSFVFDDNEEYPDSSIQTTEVVNGQASIRLDPLNEDSDSLSICVDASGVKFKEFVAHVVAHVETDRHLYSIQSIDGADMHTDDFGGATIASLTQQQLQTVISRASFFSETKIFVILFLIVAYLILLIRFTILRQLSGGYFALMLGIILFVAYFTIDLVINRPSTALGQSFYKVVILAIIAVMSAILILNYCIGRRCGVKAQSRVIVFDYCSILVYVICQFPFFTNYVARYSDEIAHLSYVAYLKKSGRVIPDFNEMMIYNTSFNGVLDFSDTLEFNYLGHPPLYYDVIAWLSDIQINGQIAYYDIVRMRFISFCIGLIALGLIFYLAYTRIPHIPLLHIFFALIIIAPPNMVYGLCGLSNDTLALLTVTIFVWGAIRFMERRYNWRTYLLIAVGISATLLTKLTAGLMVSLMGVGIVVYTLVVERNVKAIFRFDFYVTTPIYLPAVAYYVRSLMLYGTVQPSYQKLRFLEYATSPYRHYIPINERSAMTTLQYPIFYIHDFLTTWIRANGHVEIPRVASTLVTVASIGLLIILLVPFGIMLMRCNGNRTKVFLNIGLYSILFVMIYQGCTAFNGYVNYGYQGGVASRYYLCTFSVLAFTLIWFIVQKFTVYVDGKKGVKLQGTEMHLTRPGIAITMVMSLLLVFDGFIFSFLYFFPDIPALTV